MNENYLLFENYLLNNLSSEEMFDFENKLKNNASFKNDFITYKNTSDFLKTKFEKLEEKQQFNDNLKTISDRYFHSPKRKRIPFWKYGVAASILLMVGLFVFKNNTPTYNDFVTYNPIEITERSNQNHLILKAEKAYNTKDFNNAVLYLDKILKENPKNIELQLHKGFSHIELNQFNKAETILEPISNGKSTYKNRAIWYLALSNLKQKKYDDCLKHLHLIPKNSEEYTIAKELITKLQ